LREGEASDNRFLAGFAWIRLAIVSWHFDDMQSARRELERGRALVREVNDIWGIAYARGLEGAMALDAGETDAADSAYREEYAAAKRIQQPAEEFTALFGLARVASQRGQWREARARFLEAERLAQANRLVSLVPQLQYEFGLIAMRSGDLAEA